MKRRSTVSTFAAAAALSVLTMFCVGSPAFGATAETATPVSYAGHPQVGVWLILNAPTGPATVALFADGTVVFGTQATQPRPQGGVFISAQLGRWEPTGARSAHFTAIQLLSDAKGASAGSITVDAHQTVSADGQSWTSDPATAVVTIRDAAYNIVQVIGPNAPGAPVTGVRVGVGKPGVPAGTPQAGTPPA